MILPKAAWSSIWPSSRSRSAPAFCSISGASASTSALPPSGGISPVSRWRTIRPMASARGEAGFT